MIIKQDFSFGNLVKLGWNLLLTKIFFPQARIIRFPIYCKGKKYIDWGKRITTGVGCRIEAMRIEGKEEPVLKFGNNVQLNDYVHICSLRSIIIGNDVLIASHVYISDNSHGSYKGTENDSSPLIPPMKRDYLLNPVIIEDNVWIGEGVIIMPGVKIGKGSVIGAHSIVNTDIPESTIAVGSPAKVIKQFKELKHRWEKITN